MKKLAVIFCAACISAGAIAQQGVRIGNLEFSVKKMSPDSIYQAIDDPCPPCPSENETRPTPKFTPYNRTQFFASMGLIVPDNGADYYTALGGNSININAGWIRRYMLTRRFALGGTLQYSYYNYKFKDAATEPFFNDAILGNKVFTDDDIRKQVYRSHNIAVGAFTRFYLLPPKNRGNDGIFIDLGAQGDFAFSRYAMLKTHSEGKIKYNDDYAFNPFNASAVVRLGGIKIFNSTTIFARYRFTDAFNSKVLPMDLPRLTIGLQFFD